MFPDQEDPKLVRTLHALGSGSRMGILRLLLEQGVLCVGSISRRTGLTPSAVSQHLALLRDLGLVKSERRGQHVHYAAEAEELKRILEQLASSLLPGENAWRPCTGREGEVDMCGKNPDCTKPENHDGQDGPCSPEKIRECHGDVDCHPCEEEQGCE